jgi:tRNA threonylcarbamoyladenosine biosynthesis protein TsaB
MILYIDTTTNKDIVVALKKGGEVVLQIVEPAERMQAELLLPTIEKLLKKAKVRLENLTAIEVNNHGGSFTSLRIGVVTANALAFALGIPVSGASRKDLKRKKGIAIVEPKYAFEPQITAKKHWST